MKLKLHWFDITSIIKRSSHTYDMEDNITVPMIKLPVVNVFSRKYKNSYLAGQVKVYLKTYKTFTRKL
jgi:hypothetical protein